jgi:hypothetical protein
MNTIRVNQNLLLVECHGSSCTQKYFPTLIEAKKRELQIKKRKSRIYLQELIDGNSSNAKAKMVLGSPAQERDSGITSK